jgi:predicted lysophospholipase L1 biosynthesis ABC-type transport system permease subunit
MSYVAGKTKNELLTDLVSTADPGSRVHEQQKLGIPVRASEDIEASVKDLAQAVANLERSMETNSKAGEALSRRIFWLNLVLAAATVLGTVIAAYGTLAR